MSALLILKDDMLILSAQDRVGFVCCVQSWLVCGAHSVHKWRTRLSKISVTTIRLSSSAIHIQPLLRRQKASPERGVVGQQRFRKQIMPFILSMLVFGEFIVAHSKLHPKNPFANLWDDGTCYPTTQRCAWTHGLHCPPRCGFDIGASLAIEAARSLAKDWCCWDGLWRWRVKWWPMVKACQGLCLRYKHVLIAKLRHLRCSCQIHGTVSNPRSGVHVKWIKFASVTCLDGCRVSQWVGSTSRVGPHHANALLDGSSIMFSISKTRGGSLHPSLPHS